MSLLGLPKTRESSSIILKQEAGYASLTASDQADRPLSNFGGNISEFSTDVVAENFEKEAVDQDDYQTQMFEVMVHSASK